MFYNEVNQEINESDLEIIKNAFIKKQDERDFIYNIKICSLGLRLELETFILVNNIIIIGDLINEDIDCLKEKLIDFDNDEVNSILDTFNYFMSEITQTEKELENLRIKLIDIVKDEPNDIKNKKINSINKTKIDQRCLMMFKSFRDGLTLEQIGQDYGLTRERVRQLINKTIDKIGLDYNSERNKISQIREELKPKRVKKEKGWSIYYDKCVSCRTISYKHKAKGLCEKCSGQISGNHREDIIASHNNHCDVCGIFREEAKLTYGRDLYISKELGVFCRECHLFKTGKKLGDSNKNRWKKFYK